MGADPFSAPYLRNLPTWPSADEAVSPADSRIRDAVVGLVRQLRDTQLRLAQAETPHEQEVLSRAGAAAQEQLDDAVADLFRLSDRERETLTRISSSTPLPGQLNG